MASLSQLAFMSKQDHFTKRVGPTCEHTSVQIPQEPPSPPPPTPLRFLSLSEGLKKKTPGLWLTFCQQGAYFGLRATAHVMLSPCTMPGCLPCTTLSPCTIPGFLPAIYARLSPSNPCQAVSLQSMSGFHPAPCQAFSLHHARLSPITLPGCLPSPCQAVSLQSMPGCLPAIHARLSPCTCRAVSLQSMPGFLPAPCQAVSLQSMPGSVSLHHARPVSYTHLTLPTRR